MWAAYLAVVLGKGGECVVEVAPGKARHAIAVGVEHAGCGPGNRAEG